jgi:hypothetical protein
LPALPDIKDLEQLEAALIRLGAGALPPVDDEGEGDEQELPTKAAAPEALSHDQTTDEAPGPDDPAPDAHQPDRPTS